MRPFCSFCARKHLSTALVQINEAQQGYPDHVWLAIGELNEASAELLAQRPDLANRVRMHRKRFEESLAADPTGAGYSIPILELIKECGRVVAPVALPTQPEILAPRMAEPPPQPQDLTTLPPAPIVPVSAGPAKCSPCEEGAKLRAAAARWADDRATGKIERLVAIIAPLSDFNPSYSLVTVILDQARALALMDKTQVVLFVRSQANLQKLPQLPSNVDVMTSIPHIQAGEDQVEERQVVAAYTWLTSVLTLLGKAHVFTHDLVFQSWFAHWAKAFHQVGAMPGFSFYHWVHSSVGSRPTKPEAQWRASVPTGHTMVALNSADLPYLKRYYQASDSSFVSIPNPRDVRVFGGMTEIAAKLVTKHQLHLADIFQFYPLSSTRMQPKGVTKVIDIFNALCRVKESIVCRLLIADAHANGPTGKTNREIIQRYAKNVGLPEGVLAFTSESLQESDPGAVSIGLDAPSVRDLFQLANLFVFPTTSEAGSLVLMEAALSGNLLVLNESLPCMADYISTTDAIWVPFGSAKEAAGKWIANTVAGRIHAELTQSKPNMSKRAILQGHSLEAYRSLLDERIFAIESQPIPAATHEAIPLRAATLLAPSPG